MKLAFLLLSGLAMTAGVPSAPRIKVSESLRYETMTRSGGGFGNSWSETQTASRSKLTIDAELPLVDVNIDGETDFQVDFGDFKYRGILQNDPAYRPGVRSARLALTTDPDAKGSRLVLAKTELKWNAEKLNAKIVADAPDSSGAVAMAYKDNQTGKFEGMTKASIRFGKQKVDFEVPLSGKVGRKSVDVEGLSGSATTVDLKGEAKIAAS